MPEELDQPLRVTTSVEGDATVVHASGEVDAHSSEALREVLTAAIDAKRSVIIDMAEVGFIDSSGLRVLIGGYKSAEDEGVTLALRSPSDAVVRLLEITGQLERFVPDGA